MYLPKDKFNSSASINLLYSSQLNSTHSSVNKIRLSF